MTTRRLPIVPDAAAAHRAVLSRREFVRLAAVAAGAVALPACGDNLSPEACDPDLACLPTLGGAPNTRDGAIIAAFVDTVIPGQHRDPLGRLGGIDVAAPALFFDPELPASNYVPLLAAYLSGKSIELMDGRDFVALTPEEREVVLDAALASFGLLEFAVQLAKLAFYASPAAQAELGYPGANPGYLGDADFSFGAAVATGITDDGNLP